MNKEDPAKNLLSMNVKELSEKKKKVSSHLVNLECKKQQLSLLIEKLTSLSAERKNLLSLEQGQSIFKGIFSMGDQLKTAENSRKKLELEILQAKEQVKSLNSVLSERELSDKS